MKHYKKILYVIFSIFFVLISSGAIQVLDQVMMDWVKEIGCDVSDFLLCHLVDHKQNIRSHYQNHFVVCCQIDKLRSS